MWRNSEVGCHDNVHNLFISDKELHNTSILDTKNIM